MGGANFAGPSAEREMEKPATVDFPAGASKGIRHEEVKDLVESPSRLAGGECLEKGVAGTNGAPRKDSAAVDCRAAIPVLPPDKPDEPAKNPEVRLLRVSQSFLVLNLIGRSNGRNFEVLRY